MNLIPQAHAEVSIGSEFGPATYFKSLSDLINVLLPNVLTIAGIIAFIAVIVTGFKVISGAGDAKAQESSKGAFTAAVIGLIIIFGAYFFIQIFETLLGIPLLQI